MKLQEHATAGDFLDASLDVLLQEEAQNNLILGIAMRVRAGRRYGEDRPLFLTVMDGEALAAVAIQTPPYPLVLHCDEMRLEALDVLVEHLIKSGRSLPGANGAFPVVSAFVEKWCQQTGVVAHPSMSLCIHSLTDVVAPTNVPGRMRWAQEEDVPTLAVWFYAFCEEAVPEDPPADPEKSVRRFMKSGKLAVWDNDGLVSMAGSSRGTPNGATVSAVYTPLEHRGRGYASACVAALSQCLLDDGNRFCTLYTDLSNPTSNKIYQEIGYRPIVNCALFTFGEQRN